MEKSPVPPASSVAKRQSLARNVLRVSITKLDAASTTEVGTSGDDLDKEAGLGSLPSSPVTSTVSSGLVSSAANAAASGPRIDRSVASRTQFQIALPLPTGSCSQGATSTGGTGDTDSPFDQRGWSSPHGEPYRPLGKPDLSLKFSPRLADGSSLLQNAHRMKVFEGKDAGDKDNKGGSELRHATGVHSHSAVGGSGGSSSYGPGSASRPGLFEMFPLNFANKKRPLDERQVKFAHRLYASTTNYSPGKVRGLRRNPQNHHFEEQQHTHFDAALPLSSTQFHRTQQSSSHQGDESVELLRHAIRECSSRLRAVKNGASFLAQVPSSEHLDLLHLQEEYHRERAHAAHEILNNPRAAAGGGTRFKTFHQLHDDSNTPGFSESVDIESHNLESSGRLHSSVDSNDDFYLPYTTRRPQRSPHKQLPTLSEFKSRAREEKAPRPLLSLHNSTEITSSPSPLSGRRSSVRGSQINGVMGLHPSPSKAGTTPSSPSSRVSLVPPSGNGSLVTAVLPQVNESSTALGLELLPSAMRGHKQHSPPRAVVSRPLHSVERLQAAVDGIDATKRSHSKVLAKTVDSLNQNRRDCMTVKYKHFVVQHHLDDDIQHMRSASETQRTEIIEDTWHHSAWYHDLLKQLLTRDAPLHPAEAFLVRAVRRIANDGHTFDQELLFRLLLLLHRDDLLVSEVQHMLTLLRQALHITLDEWESFFVTHRLPEPVEIYEREEQKQEKKASRLSKLRTIVTLNQAVRHFSKVECNQ